MTRLARKPADRHMNDDDGTAASCSTSATATSASFAHDGHQRGRDLSNQVACPPISGHGIVGNDASQLAFARKARMTARRRGNVDPAKRAVGTIVLRRPNGGDIDSLPTTRFSGQIAAYSTCAISAAAGAGQPRSISAAASPASYRPHD